MKKYELLYIISTNANETQREAIIEKFKKFIEDRKGIISGIDKWGIKKLAYPIKFKNEGFYVLMNFEAEPSVIKEMDSAMNITENVVRKMFVAKE
ncbi:MAG: 30S ribosomal protein S6 [Clostridia bacterium]|jgi:small subunit ribosomal protein S6|nr:30S ribosomal protein S6 [Clostridia bacterium]MDD4408547.1 30S ribosomal protein S6 [Clostridia bacterium]